MTELKQTLFLYMFEWVKAWKLLFERECWSSNYPFLVLFGNLENVLGVFLDINHWFEVNCWNCWGSVDCIEQMPG